MYGDDSHDIDGDDDNSDGDDDNYDCNGSDDNGHNDDKYLCSIERFTSYMLICKWKEPNR